MRFAPKTAAASVLLMLATITPTQAATAQPYPNTWSAATELRCMSAIATRFGFVKPTVLQQRILSTYVRMHGGTPCRAFLSSRRSVGRF